MTKKMKIDEKELKSLLLQRKTSNARFKWDIEEQEAVSILKASYMAEVEHRNKIYIDNNIEVINKTAKFMTSGGFKFGLMYCGLCGNGKTTLLYALRTATYYLYDKMKLPFTIINSKEINENYKDSHDWKNLKRLFIVAIDDLGEEPTEINEYGTIVSPIKEFLEYRYEQQLPTFLTTNLTPKEIREVYGARIADRFNEMLEVIVFKNNSYRV